MSGHGKWRVRDIGNIPQRYRNIAGVREIGNCWMCGEIKGKKCAGCQARRYCSRRCQKKDWHRHKQECKDFQKYGLENVALSYQEYVDSLEKDPEFRAMITRSDPDYNSVILEALQNDAFREEIVFKIPETNLEALDNALRYDSIDILVDSEILNDMVPPPCDIEITDTIREYSGVVTYLMLGIDFSYIRPAKPLP